MAFVFLRLQCFGFERKITGIFLRMCDKHLLHTPWDSGRIFLFVVTPTCRFGQFPPPPVAGAKYFGLTQFSWCLTAFRTQTSTLLKLQEKEFSACTNFVSFLQFVGHRTALTQTAAQWFLWISGADVCLNWIWISRNPQTRCFMWALKSSAQFQVTANREELLLKLSEHAPSRQQIRNGVHCPCTNCFICFCSFHSDVDEVCSGQRSCVFFYFSFPHLASLKKRRHHKCRPCTLTWTGAICHKHAKVALVVFCELQLLCDFWQHKNLHAGDERAACTWTTQTQKVERWMLICADFVLVSSRRAPR